jgi:dTDP-4-dehydrorhamnose 3,5-epimerase
LAWIGQGLARRQGSFREWFQAKEIEQITGINFKVAQANLSHSHLGVVRGIHYSLAPEGQGKLVTCIAGLISDVIVDIRPKSKTFRKYVKVKLDGESGDFSRNQFWPWAWICIYEG